MDDSFDALPPYPGVPFPTSPNFPPPASPPALPPPPSRPSRRWLAPALGGGAVLLAVGAFLLGHSTSRAPGPSATASASASLADLVAAPVAGGNPTCDGPKRVAGGTLKSVNGSTLTVTGPKGESVTVRTDSNTKVTKVVTGALGDVTTGATVAVHGTASPAKGTASIAADHVAIVPAGIVPGVRPNVLKPGTGPAAGFGAKAAAAGVAFGTVQSVTSSGFTVLSGGTTVTVVTSSMTVFSKTTPATVGDLTVGQPIAIAGTPNSDGTITAAQIEQAAAGVGLGKLPVFGPARRGLGPKSG